MTLVFVGGSARAGTTLLQSVLCTDATTNPLIEECSYLRHLVASYAFGRDVFPYQTRDYFASPADLRSFSAGGLRHVLTHLRERHGCADLVLKEPLLTPLLPALKELLPEALCVVALRDPRDTIASMVRVLERHVREGRRSELARIGRDPVGLARHWRGFYEPLLACQASDFVRDTLLVRYEDLVESPAQTADNLRAFTGLALANFDPDAPWSNSQMDFASPQKQTSAWTSPLYGQGVTTARRGAWSEVLSDDEARVIEAECADLLEAFGYAAPAAVSAR